MTRRPIYEQILELTLLKKFMDGFKPRAIVGIPSTLSIHPSQLLYRKVSKLMLLSSKAAYFLRHVIFLGSKTTSCCKSMNILAILLCACTKKQKYSLCMCPFFHLGWTGWTGRTGRQTKLVNTNFFVYGPIFKNISPESCWQSKLPAQFWPAWVRACMRGSGKCQQFCWAIGSCYCHFNTQ